MAVLMPQGKQQFFTNAGEFLVGGQVETFASGTSTPKAAFADAAGATPLSNPIILNSRGEATIYWSGAYKVNLRDALGNQIAGYPVDPVTSYDTLPTALDTALRADFANTSDLAKGAGMEGFNPALPYAAGTAGAHMRATANVKDFGAIGTAAGAAANEVTDTIAFAAAKAAGSSVRVPAGTYYLSGASAGFIIDPLSSLIGDGEGCTTIIYSGIGNGIYMGAPGNIALAYLCKLRGIKLVCTNRASTVNGVYGDNLVHFSIDDVTVVGSGSPNSATPADWVLYGAGFLLTNNSIIGRMSRCTARIWAIGGYFKTLPASQSYWTAAIVVEGQGEWNNNMRGIVVGDSVVPLYSGVGVVIRDQTIQGNYTTGININSGDNTIIDGTYFEGNANYDLLYGDPSGAPAPIGCKAINSSMNTEDIGPTNYGNFPYLTKVYVNRGAQIKIRDNNISISTAIPLIIVDAAASDTDITGNRLNSTAAVTARISNASATTTTSGNSPEAPRVAVAAFTRVLNAAGSAVAVSGLGFRPSEIEFDGAIDGIAVIRCGGFASVESGTQQSCTSFDASNVANVTSDRCIEFVGATGVTYATLTSVNNDGYVVTFATTGTPLSDTATIRYRARRS